MKNIELTSIIGEFNRPNHNGRVYDSKMMEEAVREFNENGLKTCEVYPFEDFFSHHLENVVGKVENLWVENNQLVGKVELLDTQKGKIIEKLINNHDFKLAPRMTGEAIPVLDDNGNQKFDENNNPICEITNVNIESIDIIKKDW
jgi:hypothetical protein